MSAILLSSDRQDWRTPETVLGPVTRFFGGQIDLDPCAGPGLPIGAKTEWWGLKHPGYHGVDGLAETWSGRVFVNPPYGRAIEVWVAKCGRERAEILLLVPARVGTGWWQRHVVPAAAAVCFWRGRLKFLDPDRGVRESATFDSALVYFGARAARFRRAFARHGWVVVL